VGPFSIQVTTSSASASGSATLSWTPPTENTNGTPITDLAGYEIHYGTSADSLTQTIQVVGAATTEYEISNLAEGTYYFTVTAYNSQGIQSAPSSMASTTIG
jgi:predicted phage tail protein